MAAVLDEVNQPLRVVSKQITTLKHGEVWVKMDAAPVNPADLATLAGTYPHQRTYPFVPGIEGCGKVVASGGGFLANRLLGKRVACTATDLGDGTWGAYIKVSAAKCINVDKRLSTEQGATALVNPLTALALINLVKNNGGSCVNTAAAGALGRMIGNLAKRENITMIHVVRNAAQCNDLLARGAQIVIDASTPTFSEVLSAACKKHQVSTILDAVGGSFTDTLLQAALPGTELILYANLSKANLEISPQQIIRYKKQISGFHLGTWLNTQPLHKKILLVRKAQQYLVKGWISTPVYKQVSLPNINDAIRGYQQDMTAGKWLIRF